LSLSKPIPLELTEEWVPNQLLVRQDDAEKILELLKLWGHVYLSGPKGVGKTVVAKHILQYVEPKNQLYVQCTNSMPASIETALRKYGVKLNRNTNLAYIIAKKLPIEIAVFDDLHRLFQYRRSLYYLHSIYNEEPDDHISTILISTTPYHQFKKYCPDDVMSRFQWKPVSFGFYDSLQLETILRQRAERVFTKIEQGATNWIGAKIRRLGDPRIGIRVLRYAYQISDQLTLESVQKGWQKEKLRYWKDEVLTNYPPHAALLFYIIARLKTFPKTKNSTLTSHKVYFEYNKICKDIIGVEPLYPARLNQLLKQLQQDNWIALKTKSYGRRGYCSIINLRFDDPLAIVEAGKEIDWRTFMQ